MKALKKRLDVEVALRNTVDELCDDKPDPLMVARRHHDEHIALTCALFAYGNVRSIVGLLNAFDFSSLEGCEDSIRERFQGHYYRFQNNEDIVQWFITLGRLKKNGGAYETFRIGYDNEGIVGGLNHLINTLYTLNTYTSKGYEFLIGKPITKNSSAMKRWMMYLRWMVRHDHLDMGLWKNICPSQLIMPLDTHTFNVATKLGLLHRKQCDFRAAIELTEVLKKFDPKDPIKYDFALYRLGQEGISFL
jgi:uncharacterized protein (TIGR02757 family)